MKHRDGIKPEWFGVTVLTGARLSDFANLTYELRRSVKLVFLEIMIQRFWSFCDYTMPDKNNIAFGGQGWSLLVWEGS